MTEIVCAGCRHRARTSAIKNRYKVCSLFLHEINSTSYPSTSMSMGETGYKQVTKMQLIRIIKQTGK